MKYFLEHHGCIWNKSTVVMEWIINQKRGFFLNRNFLSKRNLFIFSLVFVLALVGFSSGTPPNHLDLLAPDTVYFNGKVITMD
jgi:hypothetical protein